MSQCTEPCCRLQESDEPTIDEVWNELHKAERVRDDLQERLDSIVAAVRRVNLAKQRLLGEYGAEDPTQQYIEAMEEMNAADAALTKLAEES